MSAALGGQVLRFGMVGGIATAVHYFVALAAAQAVDPLLANLVAYCCAVGVSYFGHSAFTFRAGPGGHGQRLPRFVAMSLSALALSQLILWSAERLSILPLWMSLAAAVAVVPVYTFLVARFWVYRGR